MAGQSLGSRVVDAFGSAVNQHVDDAPEGVRTALGFAFNAERLKVEYFPERNLMPFERDAARITLETVTDALNQPDKAVITSIFLPSEPFLAMGLKPVSAEALAGFVSAAHSESGFITQAEQNGIPETYCSFHKTLMGLATSGVLQPSRLLASCSVPCDANNLSFKALSYLWDSPHIYVDVPYADSSDAEAVSYVADQLRSLAHSAEELYGATLDEDELKRRVEASQHTIALLNRSLPLRRGRFMRSDMGNEMQLALAAHLALGTDDSLKMAEHMVADLTSAESYDGVSLVWGHIPPFFLKALNEQISQNRAAQIIATDMLYDQVGPTRPRYTPDQPFEAMAERMMDDCFNGPSTRRADRLIRLARETNADGVVIFCHWGCKETAGASQLMRRQIEEAGWPVLVLDGDGCDRDNCMEGQMSTRFSAFLELLRARHEEVTEWQKRA